MPLDFLKGYIDKNFYIDFSRAHYDRSTVTIKELRADLALYSSIEKLRTKRWHLIRKSALIQSLLLKIPLPFVYITTTTTCPTLDLFDEANSAERVCVLAEYLAGDFSLISDGLSFDELDLKDQARLEQTEITILKFR